MMHINIKKSFLSITLILSLESISNLSSSLLFVSCHETALRGRTSRNRGETTKRYLMSRLGDTRKESVDSASKMDSTYNAVDQYSSRKDIYINNSIPATSPSVSSAPPTSSSLSSKPGINEGDNISILPDITPFSMSLFDVINTASPEGSNVFISPYSIALSLGMALAGATPSSECEFELENTLGVSSKESLPQLFSAVQLEVQESPLSLGQQPSSPLSTSNSVWINPSIGEEYQSFVSNQFAATINSLPETYDPINEQIEQQTNGLITDFFTSEEIDPNTVALLVNAIYFKGVWDNQFETDKTSEGLFTTAVNTKSVKFMEASRRMEVATDVEYLDGASVIKLDYEEKQFSALFFLPRQEQEGGLSYIPHQEQEGGLFTLPRQEQEGEPGVSVRMKSMIDALVKYNSNDSFDEVKK